MKLSEFDYGQSISPIVTTQKTEEKELENYPYCPECKGQPKIETTQFSRAYYVVCDRCGWEGNIRQIESTPSAALHHWIDKVDNYRTQK